MTIAKLMKGSAFSAIAAALAFAAMPTAASAQERGAESRSERQQARQNSGQRREARQENRSERREARQETRSERRDARPQYSQPQNYEGERRVQQVERQQFRQQVREQRAPSSRPQSEIPTVREVYRPAVNRAGDERRIAREDYRSERRDRQQSSDGRRNQSYSDGNRNRTYTGDSRRDRPDYRDNRESYRDGQRDRYEGRRERREEYRDGRRDGNYRDGYRDGRRHAYRERRYYDRGDYRRDYRRWDRRDWRRHKRYDWYDYRRSHRHVFHIGRYYAPYRSHYYNRITIGFFLDGLFFGSRYWINDPWQYRLPDVYGPYRWVRYYDDVLLVNIYTGEVVDVIYDFFW